jgi:hypothetical protein
MNWMVLTVLVKMSSIASTISSTYRMNRTYSECEGIKELSKNLSIDHVGGAIESVLLGQVPGDNHPILRQISDVSKSS